MNLIKDLYVAGDMVLGVKKPGNFLIARLRIGKTKH
jgi:hypothetical protein